MDVVGCSYAQAARMLAERFGPPKSAAKRQRRSAPGRRTFEVRLP